MDNSMEDCNCNVLLINSTLCEDLLAEILSRLPLKSLFRFKSVSKSWDAIISDDHFRRRLPFVTSAVFYSDNSPRFAFASDDRRLEECNLDFFPYRNTSTIIDSCNGLLLYYSSPSSALYVVNPAVRRWAALPTPEKKTLLSIIAFDPSHSPEYTVVCFTAWQARGAEVEVFSSATATWAEHELRWEVDTDAMSATMHYFAGVLYVLAYPSHIVGINLGEMSCERIIELPEPTKRSGRIGNSGGRLHYSHGDGEEVKIWRLEEMEESKNSWVLKERIRMSEVSNLVAFHPEREVVYFWMGGKVVCYDLERKRIEQGWEFGKEMNEKKANLIQIWLFPFSSYMSDCLKN